LKVSDITWTQRLCEEIKVTIIFTLQQFHKPYKIMPMSLSSSTALALLTQAQTKQTGGTEPPILGPSSNFDYSIFFRKYAQRHRKILCHLS